MLPKATLAKLKGDMFYCGITNKSIASRCKLTPQAVSNFLNRKNDSFAIHNMILKMIEEAKNDDLRNNGSSDKIGE